MVAHRHHGGTDIDVISRLLLARLAPGYLADIAVVDHDPFDVAPSALKDLRVLLTIVGGRVVHEDLRVQCPKSLSSHLCGHALANFVEPSKHDNRRGVAADDTGKNESPAIRKDVVSRLDIASKGVNEEERIAPN